MDWSTCVGGMLGPLVADAVAVTAARTARAVLGSENSFMASDGFVRGQKGAHGRIERREGEIAIFKNDADTKLLPTDLD